MTRQINILLVILVGFLFAFWLRFNTTPLPQHYWIALIVSLVIASVVFPATGAYRSEFEWTMLRRVRRLTAAWITVLLLLIAMAAALKTSDYYSRIWFGLWSLVTAGGIIAVTLITHAYAIHKRNQNRQHNPIVLVGSGHAALQVEKQIIENPSSDMRIVERFGEAWSESTVQPLKNLMPFLQSNKVRAVWIAVPWQDKQTLDICLDALRESTLDVNVVPDLEQYRLLNQQVSEWSGLPVISLAGTPMTSAERRMKFVFDWVAALLLTMLLSPLFLLLIVIVKVSSPGPAFFHQTRNGIGGDPIEILKFRTMKLHEEQPGQLTQAQEEDDRVTAVGGFLRRTSLDELPQLINILKGDMSLVGPRPHAVEHNELFKSRIPKYMLRHKVKPGMTGWAQINGYRGQTDTQEKMALRIEHDLWYIQNWSLWLDVKILFMTPLVLIHKNAY